MAFLVKVPWSIVSVVSHLFRANQMGFGMFFTTQLSSICLLGGKRFRLSPIIFKTTVFGYMQS